MHLSLHLLNYALCIYITTHHLNTIIGRLVQVLQPMLQLWNNLATEQGLPGLYIISTIGNFYEEDKQSIAMTKNVKEISGKVSNDYCV